MTLNGGAAISNPLSDFSIVPLTTIVPVSSTASGNDTLNLASVNGFTGSVTLTCASATPGLTCTPTSPATLTSGGTTTATVNISATASVADGNYSVVVTGKDTTGELIHTANIGVVVTSSSAAFSLGNSGNITLGQGATSGNTSTITATPSGSFSGTIYLSCTVSSTLTSPTSPATCSVPASLSVPGTETGTLTVNTTGSTTAGTYTVLVTGTAGSATSTTSVTVTVNAVVGTPGFALSAATPSPATIAPGAGTSSVVTATGSNGYAGSISFMCSLKNSPPGAVDVPTCGAGSSVSLRCY